MHISYAVGKFALHPAVSIAMHKAATLNTDRTVRRGNKKCLVSGTGAVVRT